MYSLTGSMSQEQKTPLGPFEQAEQNLIDFANNAMFSQRLNEVVERIKYLETLELATESNLVTSSSNVTRGFRKQVKSEIKSIETVLKLLFDIHDNLPEA